MNRSQKILFWTSLFSIFIFVVLPIVGHYAHIGLSKEVYSDMFEEFRLFLLPLVILCSLYWTFRQNESTETRIVKVVLIVVATGFSILMLFAGFFSGMCAWTNGRVLFESKSELTTKIIVREFGCGATDSGSPTHKICKLEELSPYFVRVTEIDTSKLDRKIWLRVISTD